MRIVHRKQVVSQPNQFELINENCFDFISLSSNCSWMCSRDLCNWNTKYFEWICSEQSLKAQCNKKKKHLRNQESVNLFVSLFSPYFYRVEYFLFGVQYSTCFFATSTDHHRDSARKKNNPFGLNCFSRVWTVLRCELESSTWPIFHPQRYWLT